MGISSNTGLCGQGSTISSFVSVNIQVQLSQFAQTHPAMLLIDKLLDRLLPWKFMMLVCLRDEGSTREEWSSGDRMADQGRSLVPPAGTEGHISPV